MNPNTQLLRRRSVLLFLSFTIVALSGLLAIYRLIEHDDKTAKARHNLLSCYELLNASRLATNMAEEMAYQLNDSGSAVEIIANYSKLDMQLARLQQATAASDIVSAIGLMRHSLHEQSPNFSATETVPKLSELTGLLHLLADNALSNVGAAQNELQTEITQRGDALSSLIFTYAGILLVSIPSSAFLLMSNMATDRQLRLRLRVTECLFTNQDMESAAHEIIKLLCDHCGFSVGAMWLVDKNGEFLKCFTMLQHEPDHAAFSAFLQRSKSIRFSPGSGLPGRVWSTKEAHWIQDVLVDPNYPRAPEASKCGFHTGAAFPLMCGSGVLGVMEFYRTKKTPCNRSILDLLNSFGEELGQSIDRWQNQLRLEEENKLVRFLAEVSQCLTRENSTEEMLKECTQLLVHHLDAAFARVWLIDPQSPDTLRLKASSGMYTHIDGAHSAIRVGEYKIGAIAASRNPVLTNDVLNDPRIRDHQWARDNSMVSFAGHPLVLDNQVVGVMACFAQHPLSQRAIQSLQSIANNVALGIKHRQERQQIADNERLFRQLAENIRDAFFVVKQGPVVAYASRAYEEIWGHPACDLESDPYDFYKSLSSEDQVRVSHFLSSSKAPELARGIEFKVVRADGTVRWVWLRLFPTYDSTGKWDAAYAIAQDLTERKEAEKQVNEFYSVVSHELRTPLTSVHASLRLLETGIAGHLTEKAAELVGIARVESDRLIRLINDILDLRKLESGLLDLKRSPVLVSKLLDRAVSSMQPMAQAAGLTLKSRIIWDGHILCDEDRLLQVIENFISNAIKFSPAETTVTCTSDCIDAAIRIAVIDEGPGIPSEKICKLFNKFQQLDSSDSRAKGGTGLGLAISKAIVEQHGGKVGVDTKVGKGSSFWFDLPFSSNGDGQTTPVMPIARHQIIAMCGDEVMRKLDGLDCECYIVHRGTTDLEANELIDRFNASAVVIDADLLKFSSSAQARLPKLADVPVILLGSGERHSNCPGKYIQLPGNPTQTQLCDAVSEICRLRPFGPTVALVIDNDRATREILKHELGDSQIEVVETTTLEDAITLARTMEPDIIVLNADTAGCGIASFVKELKSTRCAHSRLVVTSAAELAFDARSNLTLGKTHFACGSESSRKSLAAHVRTVAEDILGAQSRREPRQSCSTNVPASVG